MSRGTPSMAALLGMIAIAGYQNRDKISKWLSGVGGPQGQGGGLGGLLGSAATSTGVPQGFEAALETLSRQTGLTRDEIHARLSR